GEVIRPPAHVAFVGVWSAYSPNVFWPSIVRDFLAANREAQEGKKEKLQTFKNTTLGEYWAEDFEKSDDNELRMRAEPYPLERVPMGAVMLLAGIDTQDNRLECVVWGYGRGCQKWCIAHRIFWGNPDEDEVWQDLEEFLFEKEFPHASGQALQITAAAIDTRGHKTQAVYTWVAKHQRRRIFAIAGRSGREKHIKDGASKVDIDFRGRVRKNGLVLWWVGTNLAKDVIHGRLQITSPGPGYMHFSHELSDEFYKQLTGEARTSRRTVRGEESVWTPIRKRVEVLDCTTYAVWLETHLELGKKGAKFWDDLEAKVQPAVQDLFSQPESSEPAPAKVAIRPMAQGKISILGTKRGGA
ncbi:MAG TPA: terminase gpA endonuclease subunit, partial [Noviherbaspirillum sp.]